MIDDAQIAAFKQAWAQADAEGDAGNRVRRGLEAAGATFSGGPYHYIVAADGSVWQRVGREPAPEPPSLPGLQNPPVVQAIRYSEGAVREISAHRHQW